MGAFFQSFFVGDATFYVAQIIGLVALTVAFCSFQATSQKRIVTFQLVSSVLFAVHFFLLGAYVGSLLNGLGIFRAIVFSQKDKPWAKSRIWLGIFAVVFLAAGICTLDGDLNLATWAVDFSSVKTYIGLFPIIGMEFTTFAFRADNAAKVRALSLPSSPFWLIYNAVSASWGGVLTESVVMISIIVGMLRHDLPARRKEQP